MDWRNGGDELTIGVAYGYDQAPVMGVLKPNLHVLPERQRQLWPRLAPTPQDFVLYGSTGNETKDYLDIHALLSKGKISLSEGIACATAIYGHKYSPVLTLQALSYFDDLSSPLADSVKSHLTAAVKSVSLQTLPQMAAPRKIGERATDSEP